MSPPPDASRSPAAATLVVGALAAHAVMTLLSSVVAGFLIQNLGIQAWSIGSLVVWLVLDATLVVGLLQLAGSVGAEHAGLVKLTAFGFLAVMGLDLVMVLLEQASLAHRGMVLFYDVNLLVSLVVRGLLLLLFARVAGKTQAWVLPLVALVALLTVARSAFTVASMHQLISTELRSTALYRFVLPAMSVFNASAVLACGFALRSAVSGGPQVQAVVAAAGLQPAPAQPIHPGADLLVGGILLAVGVGVTMISFSSASGGGRYVIATGAIGVGLVRLIRGLVRLGRR